MMLRLAMDVSASTNQLRSRWQDASRNLDGLAEGDLRGLIVFTCSRSREYDCECKQQTKDADSFSIIHEFLLIPIR